MAASCRSRTSQPSYSPQRGHPLRWLRWLRVVLFLGLTLVHRICALGTARSTWSTNNSHRKRMTVGAHTGKCLLIMRKIMIPPPDSWDPLEGPLYFAKKTFPTLSARTHRKCLLITHKKMNTPLLAGTHLGGRLTCGPTKFTGTEGFVNLVNMNDSSSSDHTMSIQRP